MSHKTKSNLKTGKKQKLYKKHWGALEEQTLFGSFVEQATEIHETEEKFDLLSLTTEVIPVLHDCGIYEHIWIFLN